MQLEPVVRVVEENVLEVVSLAHVELALGSSDGGVDAPARPAHHEVSPTITFWKIWSRIFDMNFLKIESMFNCRSSTVFRVNGRAEHRGSSSSLRTAAQL